MLATILQALFQFVLKLSTIFGLVFMMACTVFVIVCTFRGNIKIKIISNKAEKENE